MKLYIHHYYQKSIFYKIAHNTTNREYFIENNEGVIKCIYKNVDLELIFKQEISFEDDGYHILDYFTALFYGDRDPKIGYIHRDEHYMERETQQILTIYKNLLRDVPKNQKWIITYFRTEKILQTNDTSVYDEKWFEIEQIIADLSNHHIISDNVFLIDNLDIKYPNFYFSLTNTLFQWNEIIGIRWFYEFKQVYDKLTFDYDLMYSIKNHKVNRVNIINELQKLKNSKLLLQRSDSLQNPDYKKRASSLKNINVNSIYGDNDFSDVSWIINHQGYMDMFFRVLPKAKMQILCESWSWDNREFSSQYLSEKTFAFVLAGIPFISTHDYPLKMIEKMLEVPPHPFYNESKRCKTNGKLFARFVDTFLQNFDENYKLCKEWSDLVHIKLIYKIENENSLLDLIIDGGLKTEFVVKKSLI
jgi:hypothetical protein